MIFALLAKVITIHKQFPKIYIGNLSLQKSLAGGLGFWFLTFDFREDLQDPHQIRLVILESWGRFHWSKSTHMTGSWGTFFWSPKFIGFAVWPSSGGNGSSGFARAKAWSYCWGSLAKAWSWRHLLGLSNWLSFSKRTDWPVGFEAIGIEKKQSLEWNQLIKSQLITTISTVIEYSAWIDKAWFGHVPGHVQVESPIEEECLKWLHSVKGRKATNLVRTKRRFNFVVRLIANKCYKDTFYFLSFLPSTLDFIVSVIAFFTRSIFLYRDHIFKDPKFFYQTPGHLQLLPSSAECLTSLKIDDYLLATPGGKGQSWSLHKRAKPATSRRPCFSLLLSSPGRFL